MGAHGWGHSLTLHCIGVVEESPTRVVMINPLLGYHPTIDPPCEAPMPFSIRPYRRFPVCCPVTYHAGLCEGHGMIWNLSVNGWRHSGDVPLRVGQTCPLTVHVLN